MKLNWKRSWTVLSAVLGLLACETLYGCAGEEEVEEFIDEEVGETKQAFEWNINCDGTIITRTSYCVCGHDKYSCHPNAYWCTPH